MWQPYVEESPAAFRKARFPHLPPDFPISLSYGSNSVPDLMGGSQGQRKPSPPPFLVTLTAPTGPGPGSTGALSPHFLSLRIVLDKSLQSHLQPEPVRSLVLWLREACEPEGPELQEAAARGLAEGSAPGLPSSPSTRRQHSAP